MHYSEETDEQIQNENPLHLKVTQQQVLKCSTSFSSVAVKYLNEKKDGGANQVKGIERHCCYSKMLAVMDLCMNMMIIYVNAGQD